MPVWCPFEARYCLSLHTGTYWPRILFHACLEIFHLCYYSQLSKISFVTFFIRGAMEVRHFTYGPFSFHF
jgi:hypothetical protein